MVEFGTGSPKRLGPSPERWPGHEKLFSFLLIPEVPSGISALFLTLSPHCGARASFLAHSRLNNKDTSSPFLYPLPLPERILLALQGQPQTFRPSGNSSPEEPARLEVKTARVRGRDGGEQGSCQIIVKMPCSSPSNLPPLKCPPSPLACLGSSPQLQLPSCTPTHSCPVDTSANSGDIQKRPHRV